MKYAWMLVFITAVCSAQDTKFWSTERKLETTGLVGESVIDAVTTQMWLGASPRHTELNPVARPLVTRGNAGQVAACALGVGAVLGVQYVLYRHGHRKAANWAGRIAVVAEGLNVGRQLKLVTQ
jgi:hypothetical protein